MTDSLFSLAMGEAVSHSEQVETLVISSDDEVLPDIVSSSSHESANESESADDSIFSIYKVTIRVCKPWPKQYYCRLFSMINIKNRVMWMMAIMMRIAKVWANPNLMCTNHVMWKTVMVMVAKVYLMRFVIVFRIQMCNECFNRVGFLVILTPVAIVMVVKKTDRMRIVGRMLFARQELCKCLLLV